MRKRERNLAIGALVAAGIGYAAGLLTAPKSGKETRKDIQQTAVKAKKEAEKRMKLLHADISQLIKDGSARLNSASGTAKTELKEALDHARHAKDKAREVLSAIHEGEADDIDLKKALKELQNAKDHLKKFVKKHAS